MSDSRLGQGLVRDRLISAQQFEDVTRDARNKRQRLIRFLFGSNLIDERRLLTFLARHFSLPVAELGNFQPQPAIVQLFDNKFCNKHGVFPLSLRGDTLVVATTDPTDIQALDEIRFKTRRKVEWVLSAPSGIYALIEKHYGANLDKLVQEIGHGDEAMLAEVVNEAEEHSTGTVKEDDAPIIQYVSTLMIDAIRRRASDIHIEPYENDLRVRFRVDGTLINAANPPLNVKAALVARVKVMANMRLDEKRLPQDGRIMFRLSDGRSVDFRVNTLPTVNGEKVVLRILDKSRGVAAIEDLGFEPEDLARFKKAIGAPWGICLVTGPTGSGKTSTLYAALSHLNEEGVNISTIEEPVEYHFRGINQVSVKENIGLTFGTTLRALLRQDPDIILLGEIRDGDTVKTAMQAALTGHLVLSTIHTNDAPSTIVRLKDMGVDSFLINATLQIIVAQRLVRRVCTHCAQPDTRASAAELKKMGFPEASLNSWKPLKGKGCSHCSNTGYQGRMAVFEVLFVDEKIREVVGKNCTTDELRRVARAQGMRTLFENCMRKVMIGKTTLEELQALAVSGTDE